MQRRRRNQKNRVDFSVREQRGVVAMQALDTEALARPVEFLGDGTARGDELGARHALREVLGMAAAEAS
jgi:hypothetical protein